MNELDERSTTLQQKARRHRGEMCKTEEVQRTR
jgi:hypothetical protein